ncbi:Uncharacterised protein [Mycobacteroides abscessus subsp. massiliense]|nr:Uncharacterised protein [Mycobacteroides abscessus subsp. massiliense]
MILADAARRPYPELLETRAQVEDQRRLVILVDAEGRPFHIGDKGVDIRTGNQIPIGNQAAHHRLRECGEAQIPR